MKIIPSTEQKKPNYPALLATAVVASATLASCQQQPQQLLMPMAGAPPILHCK